MGVPVAYAISLQQWISITQNVNVIIITPDSIIEATYVSIYGVVFSE